MEGLVLGRKEGRNTGLSLRIEGTGCLPPSPRKGKARLVATLIGARRGPQTLEKVMKGDSRFRKQILDGMMNLHSKGDGKKGHISKALDEIYQMYILLHLSNRKIASRAKKLSKCRSTFFKKY